MLWWNVSILALYHVALGVCQYLGFLWNFFLYQNRAQIRIHGYRIQNRIILYFQ